MLEDDFTYVLRKALRSLEWEPAQAAATTAGLELADLTNLLAGHWNASHARQLAPAIGLDADALAAHPAYMPPPCEDPAIHRLDLPFGVERVNCWLIDAGDGWVLIDTGCDEASLTPAIEKITVLEKIRAVIITHNHHDHVGGLGLFAGRDIPLLGPGNGQTWKPIQPGDSLAFGNLGVSVSDLSGHASPAIGLHIAGLQSPVFVVGDALFAGSIGGCAGRAVFELAKSTMLAAFQSMEETTIILPGHGPATRLASEWKSNPFLAAWRNERVTSQS